MMRAGFEELPEEQRRALKKARRLEWLTIAYLVSAISILALVLGSSQAMKTAWFEDLLSLIPPIVFLLAMRYSSRSPTDASPTASTASSRPPTSAPASPSSPWGPTSLSKL